MSASSPNLKSVTKSMPVGHRRWECPAQRVYSANVICRLCGGGEFFRPLPSNIQLTMPTAGHMARDCRGRGDPNLQQNKQTAFDSEYSALMAELGEGGGPGAAGRPAGAVGAPPPQDRVPPWRLPENWQQCELVLAHHISELTPLSLVAFGGPPRQAPHMGFQQQGYSQNAGYGYGGYRPEQGYPAQGGGQAPGGADAYSS